MAGWPCMRGRTFHLERLGGHDEAWRRLVEVILIRVGSQDLWAGVKKFKVERWNECGSLFLISSNSRRSCLFKVLFLSCFILFHPKLPESSKPMILPRISPEAVHQANGFLPGGLSILGVFHRQPREAQLGLRLVAREEKGVLCGQVDGHEVKDWKVGR